MLAEQLWHKIFDMPQILFIIMGLIGIAGIGASFWYKAEKLRSENALKRTLAERGLSADEIERIIAAQAKQPSDSDG